MTIQQEIRTWLNRRPSQDITHMIVVCDDWDYEDYPVYVGCREKVREKFEEYNGKNMQRVMEVYSYGHDLESQLNEGRAFHLD